MTVFEQMSNLSTFEIYDMCVSLDFANTIIFIILACQTS